jgi:hypothetical protein
MQAARQPGSQAGRLAGWQAGRLAGWQAGRQQKRNMKMHLKIGCVKVTSGRNWAFPVNPFQSILPNLFLPFQFNPFFTAICGIMVTRLGNF